MKKLSLAIDSPAEGSSQGGAGSRKNFGGTQEFYKLDEEGDEDDPFDGDEADLIDEANL